MRRNCNLELRLTPFSDPNQNKTQTEEPNESPQQQHQLTIFYDGKVVVCDATEIQARAILWLASREMEDKLKTPTGSEPASPTLLTPVYSPTATGFSMKRSLQRFLQKRQDRIQATSPYNH